MKTISSKELEKLNFRQLFYIFGSTSGIPKWSVEDGRGRFPRLITRPGEGKTQERVAVVADKHLLSDTKHSFVIEDKDGVVRLSTDYVDDDPGSALCIVEVLRASSREEQPKLAWNPAGHTPISNATNPAVLPWNESGEITYFVLPPDCEFALRTDGEDSAWTSNGVKTDWTYRWDGWFLWRKIWEQQEGVWQMAHEVPWPNRGGGF